MTTADFNNDGKMDIVVAELLTSTVSILLNLKESDDIFISEPISFDVGWEPKSLVSGDFDKDGKQDIITVNQSSEDLTILRNTGDLSNINFEISPGNKLGRLPTTINKADLNGDGLLDLVVGDSQSDTMMIFQNTSIQGKIVFQKAFEIPVVNMIESVALADFDNDGKIDIATSGGWSTSILIYKNTSSTNSISFSDPIVFIYYGIPKRLIPADFDLDGKVDIAVLQVGIPMEVSFMRNKGSLGTILFEHEWTKHYATNGNADRIGACDLNGDGKDDLIGPNPWVLFEDAKEHNNVSVLINTSIPGQINFANSVAIGVADDPIAVTSADFDDDGKTDLCIGSDNARSVTILHNSSDRNNIKLNSIKVFSLEFLPFESKLNDPVYPCAINGGDFDRDGRIDLAITSWDDQGITFLKNNCTPSKLDFSFAVAYRTGEKPHQVIIYDFNNDGKLDVIVANKKYGSSGNLTNGIISIYQNNGNNGEISFLPDSMEIGGDAVSMALGYFNQDRKIDIAIGRYRVENHTVKDSLIILKNASTTDKILFTPSSGLSRIGVDHLMAGDFDLDGLTDLVFDDDYDQSINLLHNMTVSEDIIFAKQRIARSFIGLSELTAEDLDGDGKSELIAVWYDNWNDKGAYSIFLNKSTKDTLEFMRSADYSPLRCPRAVTIKDITNDSKPDLIVRNGYSQFTILENIGTIGSIDFSVLFPGTIIFGDNNYFIADLNGDGFQDIAAPRSDQKELWIFKTSTGPFTSLNYSVIELPSKNRLSHNFPNPFNTSTKINYEILNSGRVTIKIYNMLGREVRTLVDDFKNQGHYDVLWDGLDNQGYKVSTGVYLYRIISKEFNEVKKTIVIK